MSQAVTNLEARREIGGAFYIHIPLCQDEASIREQIHHATQIEKAVEVMLDGRASIWELFEMVEEAVPSMDQYVDEVEQNLYLSLLNSPYLRA